MQYIYNTSSGISVRAFYKNAVSEFTIVLSVNRLCVLYNLMSKIIINMYVYNELLYMDNSNTSHIFFFKFIEILIVNEIQCVWRKTIKMISHLFLQYFIASIMQYITRSACYLVHISLIQLSSNSLAGRTFNFRNASR